MVRGHIRHTTCDTPTYPFDCPPALQRIPIIHASATLGALPPPPHLHVHRVAQVQVVQVLAHLAWAQGRQGQHTGKLFTVHEGFTGASQLLGLGRTRFVRPLTHIPSSPEG